MKKFIYFTTAIISLITCTQVKAEEGFYVGAMGGINWLEDETPLQEGVIVAGSLGYKFPNRFRLEGEYSYRRNKYSYKRNESYGYRTCLFTSHVTMVHLLYDIPLESCFKPYFGCGAGYAIEFINSRKTSCFAWDMVVGVAYPITKKLDADVQFRNLHGKLHDDNSLGIGLRYSF